MNRMHLVCGLMALAAVLPLACDSSSDRCPGITCTNCSGSGDCSTTCAAGQANVSESMANDGVSANERCSCCR